MVEAVVDADHTEAQAHLVVVDSVDLAEAVLVAALAEVASVEAAALVVVVEVEVFK